MKKVFLTLLAAGLTSAAFCQKSFILSFQEKKGFVAVAAGSSLPIGQFASCSSVDERAGLATPGLTLNLSAGYRLVGRVGLMVRGERQQNGICSRGLLATIQPNPNDTWLVSTDKWAVSTLMAGPYVSIPLNRFTLDARLLAGPAQAVMPATLISGYVGDVLLTRRTSSARSTSTAYGGGLSVRYRLGCTTAIQLNGDYSQSAFQFNDLVSESNGSNGQFERTTYRANRLVRTLNVSAGFVFLFGNRNRPF